LQESLPSESARAAFLSTANQYVDALIQATGALSAICAGLAGTAEVSGSYPKEKYREDVVLYEKNRELYVPLGSVMNDAYRATYAN